VIVISATNRGSKRVDSDFYATPIPVIENLFNHYQIKEGNILEPSAGNGNFVKVIKDKSNNHITALEIREEEYDNLNLYADEVIIDDFLRWKPSKKFKTIIGNPPYSLALEFMNKCFEIADEDTEIIMLLRTAFLESQRRYEFWQKHPINKLYVLSKRPSFLMNGKSDATSYSWFIWDGSEKQEIKVI
jgi:hypothetical protein